MILVKYLEALNEWYAGIHANNNWERIEFLKQIEEDLGLTFVPEPDTEGNVCMANNAEVRDEYRQTFDPIDLLDYSYAVLHSAIYREIYNEVLKIDFSRVPYPKDLKGFWNLVGLGGELRQLHLLESPKVNNFVTTYPEDGDNMVTRKLIQTSSGFEPDNNVTLSAVEGQVRKVWINENQYFDNIPLIAWEFNIGGYQPAQKWLKDRVGSALDSEDILLYQKIIVALTETDRLMKKIDAIMMT